MNILSKILQVLAVIVVILIMILMFLLLYPFKYILDISYDSEIIILKFSYSIVDFYLEFPFSKKIRSRFKLLSIIVFDSESSSKVSKKNDHSSAEVVLEDVDNEAYVASPAEFAEDVKETKEDIKDLFISAKKMEAKQKAERKIDDKKINSLVEKFNSFVSCDTIYVVKRVIVELKKMLKLIAPKKCKIDISYGTEDPYAMGLSYMITAPLSALGGKDVDITEHFMTDTFKAHALLSNRVPKIYLLMPAIRLMSDKRFRNIIFKK